MRSKSAAPKKKDTHVGVFLFWCGRRGSTRYRHPANGKAIRGSPAGLLDLTRFAQVEAASSNLPAAKFQKETPSFRMVFLFVIAHRFCYLYTPASQGKNVCKGCLSQGSRRHSTGFSPVEAMVYKKAARQQTLCQMASPQIFSFSVLNRYTAK